MRPEIPACRLLILDLDNTLIRERDYLDGAYSAVAELLAGKSGSDAGALHARMLEMLDSQGRERLFDKICFELSLPECVPACLEALRRVRLTEPLVLVDWAKNVLREHTRRGGVAAVLTNGHPGQQMNKFVQVDWAGAPVPFLCLADVIGPKPAPAGIKWLLNLFDMVAADAVFVGDAEIDRQAAVAAGVQFVKA